VKLELRGITKRFGDLVANDSIDLVVEPGEIHALLGENGAGKSTLMNVLYGLYAPDEGEILVDDEPVTFRGPGDAMAAGIGMVHQHFMLIPVFTVAENVMLGHEETRRIGFLDRRRARRDVEEISKRYRLDVPPDALIADLPVGVQQRVEIIKALSRDARVLILDEPTSSLDSDEVARLFDVIRTLRDRGVAILFVSHFLDQVYAISDRITVLRNGTLVGEFRPAELPRVELVGKMIGRTLEVLTELEGSTERAVVDRSGTPFLQAIGVGRRGSIEPFDLEVYPGEIVGLAGLLGSGRTELARLLYGADHADTGETIVDGTPVKLRNPRHGLSRSIVFSSESRKAEGIIGDLTVRENIVLGLQAERGWMRRVPKKKTDEVVSHYIEALGVRPANPDAIAGNLSGGNQQKVLLARWLATAPKLLILDEPTRGIDVGAKAEIQKLVADLAAQGMSVVFISAELDEVLRLSHRIAVLRDRRKVGELTNSDDVTTDVVVDLIASGGTSA
jgi:monosaccharide-transporting ATPase